MISDECFVGCLAIGVAIITLVIALGPWNLPYRSRAMISIGERYGKKAARLVWLLIAIISAASGVSILNEIRPSDAAPAVREKLAE